MANIQTYLQRIKSAIYGREVRDSIHDAIDAINTEVEEAHDEIDEFVQSEMDTALTSTELPAQGKAVGDAIEDVVIASDTQPTSEFNQIWIDEDGETEYQVPTYSEFSEVKNALSEIVPKTYEITSGGRIDAHSGNVVETQYYSYTDYIDISAYKNDTAVIMSTLFGTAGFSLYNENKQYIYRSGVDGTDIPDGKGNLQPYKILVPKEAKYIRYSLYNAASNFSESGITVFVDQSIQVLNDEIEATNSTINENESITNKRLSSIENAKTSDVSILSKFVRGSIINTGTYDPAVLYRVVSSQFCVASNDISIIPESGFRFAVHFYVNGTHSSDTGWKTGAYTIPSGSEYKIVIARVTENTSETANIDEFVSALKIETNVYVSCKAVEANNNLRVSESVILEIDRYRAINKQKALADTNYIGTADNGYYVAVTAFNNSSYSDTYVDTGWKTSIDITIPSGKYVQLTFRRSDYANLTDSDLLHYSFSKIIKFLDAIELKQDKSDKPKTNEYLNIFKELPLYHHMNQEEASPYIPAESLYDIAYAKRLGFNLIEVNPHKCSDGVFVCKHGQNGNIGAGVTAPTGVNPSTTSFSSVTSTWLRENVRYNSISDKFKGYIPTLDEVCAECQKQGLMLKIANNETLPIARKYLTDDKIWLTTTERGDFTGTIEYVHYKSQSVSNCISICKSIGAPLNIVIAAGEISQYTSEEIMELTYAAHLNGFTVGAVYPTANQVFSFLELGIDTIGITGHAINWFSVGTDFNVYNMNDNRLALSDGVTYDSQNDILTLPVDSKVSFLTQNEPFYFGIVSLVIRFSGTLSIETAYGTIMDSYASDGTKYIKVAIVIQRTNQPYTKWFEIVADANTVVYSLEAHGSKIAL